MPVSTRALLAYLALTGAVVGVWAAAFPYAFYASFPGLGRSWVAMDGPFNEHLVRDTGDAYLMIGVLAALCLWRPARVSPFAVGLSTLVFNAPHFAYHVTHLSMLAPLDRVLNVLVLGAALLASLWLLTPSAAAPHRPVSGGVRSIERLLGVMARLRDPEHGCPWDVEQTFASVAPYTVEEAYEVADAIERGDLADLREELGDLLLQVVFHSRMAEELGAFRFDDVATAIVDKMERRHPHVFGDAQHRDSAAQTVAWEAQKAQERAAKGAANAGVLADVPAGLPALTRAVKLTKRAARVGFDWPDVATVMDKLREEAAELEAELPGADPARIREELGDLMFVCANLARKLDVEPEDALRSTNAKFVRRFSHIEASLKAQNRTPEQSDLAEMDALWNAAKALEKAGALQSRRDEPPSPEPARPPPTPPTGFP